MLFLGSRGAGWGTRTQGPESPEPRLTYQQAGAHWVGPSSASLFVVTVLGAGLGDIDTAHWVNKSGDLEEWGSEPTYPFWKGTSWFREQE